MSENDPIKHQRQSQWSKEDIQEAFEQLERLGISKSKKKKLSKEDIIAQAHKNIKFKKHLLVFILVNSLLLGLDFFDNGKLNWFYFASLGWGIGLLSHYISIKPISLFSVEKEIYRLTKKNLKP